MWSISNILNKIPFLRSSEAEPCEDADGCEDAEGNYSQYLDLAFAMDCTGSMGSYIKNAQTNIRNIVEKIVSEEKADVRLALVEYRDHPPQERTFVTRVHDFTRSVRSMKQWLDACRAHGGGDTPEAVADALHEVLKLNWRENATKVCVFIADAPPHGLGEHGDSMPNGCPKGLDPMNITKQMSAKEISMYVVGCEPSIDSSRDFFMGLAHLTGGQYVPLGSAHLLANVIIGGVQEQLDLQQLMADVNQEVEEQFAAGDEPVEEEELTKKIHQVLKSKGARTRVLRQNQCELEEASELAQKIADCADMVAARDLKMARVTPSRFEQSRRKTASSAADVFDTVEDGVSEQQVQRMVQKSVCSRDLMSRYKKKH